MAEREQIHAVHADDQADLLEQLGLLESFNAGTLMCRTCGRPVNDRGLGLIQMNGAGVVEVGCAVAGCSSEVDEGH